MLHELTAVITGGASGIGWATAQLFRQYGANVVIADMDETRAEQRASELDSSGRSVLALKCNVTSERDIDAVVSASRHRYGAIDVFVNNAGITRDNVMRRMSLGDFNSVIATNLTGAWLGTRAAVAAMRETNTAGSVINMSSISGKVGNAGQTNYSAAKAGIIGLTKAAAKEAGRHNIRVNAIQPGLIRTDMTAGMDQTVLASRLNDVPLRRIGEVNEVAKVAAFLASDLSSYVTGAVIEVTGGRHI